VACSSSQIRAACSPLTQAIPVITGQLTPGLAGFSRVSLGATQTSQWEPQWPRDGGLRWAGHARPVSGADHHPGGDPQRHPPGPAIGPAPPSAGRAASPEATAQEVGWGWRGEISRLSFDPLLTRGTLRGLGNPGSRMGLGKDSGPYQQDVACKNRHRASPQSVRRVAGSCSRRP
jgi:hypothetical protein